MQRASSGAPSVPRLRYPELGGFEAQHYAANEPAVIVGVKEHHALNIFDFSPEYLADKLGDKTYPVLRADTGFLSYERDTVEMTFSDFVQNTFHDPEGKRYYFKNPTNVLPPGLEDCDRITGLSRFFDRSVVRNLWIARGSTTVGLHFDAAENLNIQLRGRKRFMLYPPGTDSYYPSPMFSQTAHISRVFREGPELDQRRFPKFDPSQGREVILEEGEILYLPPYWWHQVTSLGDVNVNINTWSFPAVRKQISNWNQALRGHYQLLSRLVAFGDIAKAPPRTPSER
jgi:hypothetical protein